MKSSLILVALACEFAQAVATASTSTTTASADPKHNQTISASVPMNSMTITIGIIFLLQLLFCFGICVYTNKQVKEAERNATQQQSEFYQFLYQFHKQMADEEQQMHQYLGGKAGGATPTGARGNAVNDE